MCQNKVENENPYYSLHSEMNRGSSTCFLVDDVFLNLTSDEGEGRYRWTIDLYQKAYEKSLVEVDRKTQEYILFTSFPSENESTRKKQYRRNNQTSLRFKDCFWKQINKDLMLATNKCST